jgi:hypothetical protein
MVCRSSDRRADDRGLRVSVHDPEHLVVLSSWRNDHCVATVQLTMAEAGRLAQQLVGALTDAVPRVIASESPHRVRIGRRVGAWLGRFRRPHAQVVDLDEHR